MQNRSLELNLQGFTDTCILMHVVFGDSDIDSQSKQIHFEVLDRDKPPDSK